MALLTESLCFLLRWYYYLCVWISIPLYWLWDKLFAMDFVANQGKKVIVLGTTGGEYKTTLVDQIEEVHGMCPIRLDECFYGPNWYKHSAEKFKENVLSAINDSENILTPQGTPFGYVIEGVHSYPDSVPDYQVVVEELIDDCETVIYLKIPMWVSMWRKAWRSYKRAIGVEYGQYNESWRNVYYMLRSVWKRHGRKQTLLENMWKKKTCQNNTQRFVKVEWPNYVVSRHCI